MRDFADLQDLESVDPVFANNGKYEKQAIYDWSKSVNIHKNYCK